MKIVSGDTLWSIARVNNTTVDKIKEANNLTSNLLSLGQQLIIPSN
ncbi:MAG: LysM peptidoglycan-binding domain-containing protein [Bacilli bacterium]|nr:LysM peptidoglycan-binding domain-containing protein [Bacilli bacterium]